MEREFQENNAALADFKNKMLEAHDLLEKIGEINDEEKWNLYADLFVEPGIRWREMGPIADKSQFFHAFISSTTDWQTSPELDLPDGLIGKHLNEIVLPRLRAVLLSKKS